MKQHADNTLSVQSTHTHSVAPFWVAGQTLSGWGLKPGCGAEPRRSGRRSRAGRPKAGSPAAEGRRRRPTTADTADCVRPKAADVGGRPPTPATGPRKRPPPPPSAPAASRPARMLGLHRTHGEGSRPSMASVKPKALAANGWPGQGRGPDCGPEAPPEARSGDFRREDTNCRGDAAAAGPTAARSRGRRHHDQRRASGPVGAGLCGGRPPHLTPFLGAAQKGGSLRQHSPRPGMSRPLSVRRVEPRLDPGGCNE